MNYRPLDTGKDWLPMPAKITPTEFWNRVEKTDTCWLWRGPVSKQTGYGASGHHQLAHRRAYELSVGPIPDGLVIDHLCSVRLCCNPAHLEAVTQQENVQRVMRRITHCPQGHEYTPENTAYRHGGGREGHRMCRTCNQVKSLAAYYRRKA